MQYQHGDDRQRIDLNALDPEDYLGTAGAAAAVEKHPATLTRWRQQRRFLPFMQVGSEVRYKVGDLRDFLKAARIEPEVRR